MWSLTLTLRLLVNSRLKQNEEYVGVHALCLRIAENDSFVDYNRSTYVLLAEDSDSPIYSNAVSPIICGSPDMTIGHA